MRRLGVAQLRCQLALFLFYLRCTLFLKCLGTSHHRLFFNGMLTHRFIECVLYVAQGFVQLGAFFLFTIHLFIRLGNFLARRFEFVAELLHPSLRFGLQDSCVFLPLRLCFGIPVLATTSDICPKLLQLFRVLLLPRFSQLCPFA